MKIDHAPCGECEAGSRFGCRALSHARTCVPCVFHSRAHEIDSYVNTAHTPYLIKCIKSKATNCAFAITRFSFPITYKCKQIITCLLTHILSHSIRYHARRVCKRSREQISAYHTPFFFLVSTCGMRSRRIRRYAIKISSCGTTCLFKYAFCNGNQIHSRMPIYWAIRSSMWMILIIMYCVRCVVVRREQTCAMKNVQVGMRLKKNSVTWLCIIVLCTSCQYNPEAYLSVV